MLIVQEVFYSHNSPNQPTQYPHTIQSFLFSFGSLEPKLL
nr:MAG TPA: hypothetical protein [Caudoviricetes sp.]